MNWYKINDPDCEFCNSNGAIYGKINGEVFLLGDTGFIAATQLVNNPYLPDEITDQILAHARMFPHHFEYAKAHARKLKSRLRRNSMFLPKEVKDVFSTHAKMLPHHVAYARAMIGRNGSLKSLKD